MNGLMDTQTSRQCKCIIPDHDGIFGHCLAIWFFVHSFVQLSWSVHWLLRRGMEEEAPGQSKVCIHVIKLFQHAMRVYPGYC